MDAARWAHKRLAQPLTAVEALRGRPDSEVIAACVSQQPLVVKHVRGQASCEVLDREVSNLLRLRHSALPVARVCAYERCGDEAWLATSRLPGRDLADRAHGLDVEQVTTLLAEALARVHALPLADWPHLQGAQAIVHGDPCLPNFLVAEGQLSGIVDVGLLGPGDLVADFAWACWSLRYNFGVADRELFARAYGPQWTPQLHEGWRQGSSWECLALAEV